MTTIQVVSPAALDGEAGAKEWAAPRASGAAVGRRCRPSGTACGIAAVCVCAAAALGVGIAALVLVLVPRTTAVTLSTSAAAATNQAYAGPLEQGAGYFFPKGPMPAPLSDGCVVSVNNLIFILGGANSTGGVVTDAWAFDPVSETYSARAPLPSPRYRAACAADAASGLVYLVNGLDDAAGSPLSSGFVYNTAADTWAALPAATTPRTDSVAAFVAGKLCVTGGYNVNYGQLKSLEVFTPGATPGTGAWAAGPDMPSARGDATAVAWSGTRMFVFGGWYDSVGDGSGQWAVSPAVEVYDAAASAWSIAASMLTGRGDAAAVVYRSRILLLGGEAPCPAPYNGTGVCPTHDVQALLPDATPAGAPGSTTPQLGGFGFGPLGGSSGGPGVWAARAPLPGARFRFGAATVESLAEGVFLFGGQRRDALASAGGTTTLAAVSAFYDAFRAPLYAMTQTAGRA